MCQFDCGKNLISPAAFKKDDLAPATSFPISQTIRSSGFMAIKILRIVKLYAKSCKIYKMPIGKEYIKELKRRAKKSRVYKNYQLIGLEIAQMLQDEKHKSLYIKLAKNNNSETLLATAKDISGKKGIKNKGAYFMAIIAKLRENISQRKSDTARMRKK